jgi:hypothetical protein
MDKDVFDNGAAVALATLLVHPSTFVVVNV